MEEDAEVDVEEDGAGQEDGAAGLVVQVGEVGFEGGEEGEEEVSVAVGEEDIEKLTLFVCVLLVKGRTTQSEMSVSFVYYSHLSLVICKCDDYMDIVIRNTNTVRRVFYIRSLNADFNE